MREMQFIMSMVMSVFSRRLQNSAVSNWTCCMYSRDMKSHCRSRQSLYFRSFYLNKRLSTSTKPFAKAFQLFLKLYLLIQLILWIPNTHASRYEFCTTILQQPYRHYQVTKRYEKVIRGLWVAVAINYVGLLRVANSDSAEVYWPITIELIITRSFLSFVSAWLKAASFIPNDS